MIHCPIYGSIINPPMPLFKRFVPDETAEINGKVIKYETSCFRSYRSFAYVEATDKEKEELQLLKGLESYNEKMAIKLNGRYIPIKEAIDEPEENDIVSVDNEFWIIKGVRRKRYKSLVNMAVIYLSLGRVENVAILTNNK